MSEGKRSDAICCSRMVTGGLALGVALFLAALIARPFLVAEGMEPVPAQAERAELSLITDTPEEGMQVAIRLARLGVTETQRDREVLHSLRPEYASDAGALIASSHVIAVHFQTVAAANDYWR
jgi:hypothetical protein